MKPKPQNKGDTLVTQFRAELGVTPDQNPPPNPVVFESIAFESPTVRTAKGHLFKLVKACEQVIDAFSAPDQPWEPTESQWDAWQPEEPCPPPEDADGENWMTTYRHSKDLCVQRIGDASCKVFMRLFWQEQVTEDAETEDSAESPSDTEETQ